MSPVSIENSMPEQLSCSSHFCDLRGVQWRIDLGILPSPSASVEDLRRVAANCRRRYASLRKQLLVDPHVPKDGSTSPDPVMDNPLSQDPDSMWGRFFRNAELERMLDQDLTRLYPERSSYFQTSGCQGMLRRILLLWCLSHPEYGYRQGMHELLAPLLYVLHIDVERLSEVRKAYEDHFADTFDGFSYHENDFTYKFDFKKFSEDGKSFEKSPPKATSLSDLDPVTQTIVLLSDAYGAEGELGIVLSEKFMEHDAYSMFDSLMSGNNGVVSMAEFFSPSPYGSSGFSPVIEASAALYHLLSVVDSSLHTHLVELGVEPQYFSLRWLRVLFGREFSLEDLLVIWDEVFSRDNKKSQKTDSNFGVLDSPRGAFISAFAVSMILILRSSLLATENATVCLQRLLNFPEDVNLMKLVEKAKSLHNLAVEVNHLFVHSDNERKPLVNRGHSLSLDSSSPGGPLNVVPDSYWEEKWRVLHKEEEKNNQEQVPRTKKGWSERVRLRLARTESDPSPSHKTERTKKIPSVRRNLLQDLARQLGSDEDIENTECNVHDHDHDLQIESQENSPSFSDSSSPINGNLDQENESENSSVASNSSINENEAESCGPHEPKSPAIPVSVIPDNPSPKCTKKDDDLTAKSDTGVKEQRKILSGKFQWLWKLGRNVNEGTSERLSASGEAKVCNGESGQNNVNTASFSKDEVCDSSSGTSKGETVDQNLMVSLRNLGQSMLENIQVIESVFQQERGQLGSPENSSKNGLVGKGQVTAMSALKELRKISNILSEM